MPGPAYWIIFKNLLSCHPGCAACGITLRLYGLSIGMWVCSSYCLVRRPRWPSHYNKLLIAGMAVIIAVAITVTIAITVVTVLLDCAVKDKCHALVLLLFV